MPSICLCLFADKNASNDQRITGSMVLSRMMFSVNELRIYTQQSNRELFVFFNKTKTNKSRIKKKKTNHTPKNEQPNEKQELKTQRLQCFAASLL